MRSSHDIQVKPTIRYLKDADRDYWMTSEEAKTYGMIDEVLIKSKTT